MSNLQYQIGAGGGGAGPAGPPGPPGSVNTTVNTFTSESAGIAVSAPGDFFRVEEFLAAPYQDAPVDRLYFHAVGGSPLLVRRSPQRVVDVEISNGAEPSNFIDLSATAPDYSVIIDVENDPIYKFFEIVTQVDLTITTSPVAAIDHFYEQTYENSFAAFITFARGSINIPAGAAIGEVFTYYVRGVVPMISSLFISGNEGGNNTFGNVSFNHSTRIVRLIDAPSFANEPS